jgi:hypothetical protein
MGRELRRQRRAGGPGTDHSGTGNDTRIVVADDEKIKLLTSAWRRHDSRPPRQLLEVIAQRFDIDVAVRAIDDVGRAGNLARYEPHLTRFIELRLQSRRILGGSSEVTS